LLKFARAKDEVARGDLVAERLSDLRDTEGDLDAASADHVLEVSEDALWEWGEVGELYATIMVKKKK